MIGLINKKSILNLIFCFIMVFKGQAQLMPEVVPPSPEAASLGKYGEYPVSKYTGLSNISIPIYKIQSRDISLPISLTYHSSGIKVAEEASMVGLGWTLNYGGIITRITKGGDDLQTVDDRFSDVNHGGIWYKGFPYDPPIPDPVDGNYQQQICGNYIDSEPDIFYFNFFGKSGKFILGKGQNINDPIIRATLIDKEKLEIIYDKTKLQWEVTTKDGFLFIFKTMELVQVHKNTNKFYPDPTPYYHNPEDMVVSGWYLNKIVSPMGEEVNYVYDVVTEEGFEKGLSVYAAAKLTKSENISQVVEWVETTPNNACFGGIGYQRYYTTTIQYSTLIYPKEINYSSGKIVFEKSAREDMKELGRPTPTIAPMNYLSWTNKPAQKIDKILVYDYQNKIVEKTEFNYNYFNSTYSGNDEYLFKRLKLTALKKCNSEGDCNPGYSFKYDESISLPSKISYAEDFWGYYNGESDNTSYIPLGLYSKTGSAPFQEIGSANRFPDLNHTKAGILEKITFPTGGYTEFIYGLNDYSEYGNHGFLYTGVFPERELLSREIQQNGNGTYARLAGGLRIEKIISSDGFGSEQTTTFEYTKKDYAGNKYSSGKLMMLPNYHILRENFIYESESCYAHYNTIEAASWSNVALGNSAAGSIVGYDEVTITKAGNGYSEYSYHNEVETLQQGSLFIPGVPNIVHNLNGLPKGETHYDEQGNYVQSVSYHYKQQLKENIYGLAFDVINHSGTVIGGGEVSTTCLNAQATQRYYYIADRWVVDWKEEINFFPSGAITTVTDYTYDQNSHLQLKLMEEKRSDGKTLITSFKYPSDYLYGDTNLPVNIMVDRHILSPVIEKLVKIKDGDAETLFSAELMSYKLENGLILPYKFRVFTSNEGVTDFEESNVRIYPDPILTVGDFNYDPRYITEITFNEYDEYGNLLKKGDREGKVIFYEWSTQYNHLYPTAKTINPGTSTEQRTTFTYKPGIGLASKTDPNGRITQYQYDNFNRLKCIKDQQGNIMESYKYNYKIR